jgi:hypothetical protein
VRVPAGPIGLERQVAGCVPARDGTSSSPPGGCDIELETRTIAVRGFLADLSLRVWYGAFYRKWRSSHVNGLFNINSLVGTRLVTQTIVALSSTPTNCGIGLSIISQPSSVSTPTTFTLMMRTTPSGTNITFTSSLL